VTVTETENRCFLLEVENRNRGFFGAKWRRFCRPTFVFI